MVILAAGTPMWLSGKESACSVPDVGLIPGSGRSPGKGNGNPLQYSCLEIPWTEEPGRLQSMRLHRYITLYLSVDGRLGYFHFSYYE